MISRNTGRTASRGKAPIGRRRQPLQHRTLALRDVERRAAARACGARPRAPPRRGGRAAPGSDRRPGRSARAASSDPRRAPPGMARTIIEKRKWAAAPRTRVSCTRSAYGLLTALTPCVYPMIPITVAIFGVKAGMPRWRAHRARRRVRRRHRRDVRRAGDGVRAVGQEVRHVPGQPVGGRAAGAVLRGDGAVDVRGVRARVPTGLQERLSRVGGTRFRRRVPDGPRGGHHRRAVHGTAARRAAGLRDDHARRRLGVRDAGDLRRRRRRTVLVAGGVLDVAAAARPRGWSGSRASSASCCSWPPCTT